MLTVLLNVIKKEVYGWINEMINKSKERANEILGVYISRLEAQFKESIVSAILVGSLSNDSYVGGDGRDIDVIVILKAGVKETVRENIVSLISEIDEQFEKAIPIAKTVYYLNELQRPFNADIELVLENKNLIEVTTELMRIHDSGVTLLGDDIIMQLPIPTREEVYRFHKLAVEWSDKMSAQNKSLFDIDQLPLRIWVQIVITRAFRHYYYQTGKSCSNKHTVATKMRESVKGYKFQDILDLATEIKMNPQREISEDHRDKLRNGCKELLAWCDENPIDAVPITKRFTMPVAVHLLLIKERKVLLLRRFNTGYEDGNYSVVAGHVDGDENYVMAMMREAKEEAGITIEEKDLETVQVMHRKSPDRECIDYFFAAEQWAGEIQNMEPEKCDRLEWFDLDQLPDNVVPYVREAIGNYLGGDKFTVFGWNEIC